MNTALSRKGLYALTIALVLQGAHMLEHFAQFYQHAFLYLPIKESHGVLFFFDLEWNHFDFNLLYFVFFVYAAVKLGFFDPRTWTRTRDRIYRYIFLAGLLVQGYHVLEHTARIGQLLQSGCTPCPGFLGWYFDGIYLHFVINTITFALPLIAFFGLRLHRELFRKTS